jgi:uncharacterized protein (TIGR03067 family)
MKTLMGMAVLSGLLSVVNVNNLQAEEKIKPEVSQALQTFAGTWQIKSVEPKGATQAARRLVFRKDLTYAALDENGNELWSGTFDLDPTVRPGIWDHRSHEARKKGGDALGIYELDGNRLKVCCVVGTWNNKQWMGKPRPTKFQLPTADVVLLLECVTTAP